MPSNHGHVFPNPSGHKARCGGPALCTICQKDLQEFAGAQGETIKTEPATNNLHDLNKDIADLRHNITAMGESLAKLQAANEQYEEAQQMLKTAVAGLQAALGKGQ